MHEPSLCDRWVVQVPLKSERQGKSWCYLATLMLITLAVSPIDEDSPNRYVIVGKYITMGQESDANIENESLDRLNLTATVTRAFSKGEGGIQREVLATGSFDRGSFYLEGEIDQPTKVEITVHSDKERELSTNALIVPGGESVSFAYVNHKKSSDEVVLLRTSRLAMDLDRKFSVSGEFDPALARTQGKHFWANVTSIEYDANGKFNKIDFGRVLVENGKYRFEAETDEPRIAKLEISNELYPVWWTWMVIEPNVDISVERHGPDGSIMEATSQSGRHARLLDSWRLSKEYLSLLHASNVAGEKLLKELGPGKPIPLDSEVLSLWQDQKNLQLKELEHIAWESEDPIDSLLALEIATELFLIPDSLDGAKVVSLYDELLHSLDKSIVARRVSPARNRLAADLERVANSERLVVGEEVPDFELANLDGELISLKAITRENELLLLDFWASWCGPCIEAFSPLKDLYADYKENGFEIVTISVDTSFEVWEETSTNHNLPWVNLGAMKGFGASAAVEYGVFKLPTNFLVDVDGRIVQKSLDPNQLEKILETRFKGQSN